MKKFSAYIKNMIQKTGKNLRHHNHLIYRLEIKNDL